MARTAASLAGRAGHRQRPGSGPPDTRRVNVVVAAVGVTMTIAYAVFAVNYLLFAVFLTDFVVRLMALLGETADQTATARLADVLTGATDEFTDALDTAADVLRRRLSG